MIARGEVKETLIVSDITVILGNGFAGERIVPNPVVCSVLTVENNNAELENEYLELLLSCADTRSAAKANADAIAAILSIGF